MRIMLFGGTGKVGNELLLKLRKKHSMYIIDRYMCNLNDPVSAGNMIIKRKPDVVINAAAFNGMEQCSNDPLAAYMVNSSAPAVMANACKMIGSLMIHYSTDYVFSGDEMGLFENTPLKPSGVYGWSKAKGEEAVACCGEYSLTLRLSSIYGRVYNGPLDPIAQALNGKGSMDEPIMVLHQKCAPTSARLVADATAHIIENTPRNKWGDVTGTYHIATSLPIWKKDFAIGVLGTILPRIETWIVREGTLPVPRPVHTVLKCAKFENTFNYRLPTWREDLSATLDLLPKIIRGADGQLSCH